MTNRKRRVILPIVLLLVCAGAILGYCMSRDILPWRQGTLETFYGDTLGLEDVTGCIWYWPEPKVMPQTAGERLSEYVYSLDLLSCARPNVKTGDSDCQGWMFRISGPDDTALNVSIQNAYTLFIGAAGGEFDSLPSWQRGRYFVTEEPLNTQLLQSCFASEAQE